MNMPDSQRFLARDATEQDLPFLRSCLPDALGGTPPARIGLAIEAATGAVAGVASLRVFSDRVGRFLLFVAPPFRRRGCGTFLLEIIRRVSRPLGVERLVTGRSYPEASDDDEIASTLAFFRARGMSVGQVILGYRAEMSAVLALLEPLHRRAESTSAHFRNTRIVTADQVDRDALADFAVRHVGGYPEDVADRLSGRGEAFFLPGSLVALQDHRIVGAFLTRLRGQIGFIEIRAVEREHRGGWTNLALMHHAVAVGLSLGVPTLEFEGDSQDHDTTKLARRLGAAQVARRQRWELSVAD
jgi:GNAT superfamily N-acetyltransferase